MVTPRGRLREMQTGMLRARLKVILKAKHLGTHSGKQMGLPRGIG